MNDVTPDARDATYKALAQDGLVLIEGHHISTSKLWQAALARSALDISEQKCEQSGKQAEPSSDFRLPIVMALMSLYQKNHDNQVLSEAEMTARVDALLALEVDYLQSLLQTQH
jgi:hypothetical protein